MAQRPSVRSARVRELLRSLRERRSAVPGRRPEAAPRGRLPALGAGAVQGLRGTHGDRPRGARGRDERRRAKAGGVAANLAEGGSHRQRGARGSPLGRGAGPGRADGSGPHSGGEWRPLRGRLDGEAESATGRRDAEALRPDARGPDVSRHRRGCCDHKLAVRLSRADAPHPAAGDDSGTPEPRSRDAGVHGPAAGTRGRLAAAHSPPELPTGR